MNRYLLFCGVIFYPSGGMLDFLNSSDTLEELIGFIHDFEYGQWAHIYDIEQRKIILEIQNTSTIPYEEKYEWRTPDE